MTPRPSPADLRERKEKAMSEAEDLALRAAKEIAERRR